jgi:hypothetical protein
MEMEKEKEKERKKDRVTLSPSYPKTLRGPLAVVESPVTDSDRECASDPERRRPRERAITEPEREPDRHSEREAVIERGGEPLYGLRESCRRA